MSAPSTSSLSVNLLSQVIDLKYYFYNSCQKVSLIASCNLETEKYEGVIFKVNCVTSMGKWFTTELINSVDFQSFYGQGKWTLSSQFNDKLLFAGKKWTRSGAHIDEKKNSKLFFTALVFHFAWSEFTSIFQSLWVCSTISHCSQLHGNLGDSWSYPFVAYIVVIRRKFPNESSYQNTKQTALTLVIYKICPSLYYNFQLRRTNLAVIEVNEQRCIHIFFFLELKKCN